MLAEIGHDFIATPGLLGLMWKNDNTGSLLNGSGELSITVITLGSRSVGDNQETATWVGSSQCLETLLYNILTFFYT